MSVPFRVRHHVGAPAGLTSLAPLTRTGSLRESATKRLRTAVNTGELPGGGIVSAPTLGQCMGVSAAPVHEARMRLVRAGRWCALMERHINHARDIWSGSRATTASGEGTHG